MFLIVLYFLHSTSVLSFYIDVVLTLSIISMRHMTETSQLDLVLYFVHVNKGIPCQKFIPLSNVLTVWCSLTHWRFSNLALSPIHIWQCLKHKIIFDSGLAQDCGISSALALEILQSCTKTLIASSHHPQRDFIHTTKTPSIPADQWPAHLLILPISPTQSTDDISCDLDPSSPDDNPMSCPLIQCWWPRRPWWLTVGPICGDSGVSSAPHMGRGDGDWVRFVGRRRRLLERHLFVLLRLTRLTCNKTPYVNTQITMSHTINLPWQYVTWSSRHLKSPATWMFVQ